ncbi:MAG: hypothetical protein WKF59_15455 [Chitinophagaceae bacterium]
MATPKLPPVLPFLLFGIFYLITFSSNAQSGIYDVYDSTVIAPKKMNQQNEFWNNTYSFPAKPRNQLEIGISGGMFSVSGDVPSKILLWVDQYIYVKHLDMFFQ